jgi:hypothetical protein
VLGWPGADTESDPAVPHDAATRVLTATRQVRVLQPVCVFGQLRIPSPFRFRQPCRPLLSTASA